MSASEILFSVQESPEGGYEARALGYSIFTQAETMDDLRANVKEAVACHFADRKTLPPTLLSQGAAQGKHLRFGEG